MKALLTTPASSLSFAEVDAFARFAGPGSSVSVSTSCSEKCLAEWSGERNYDLVATVSYQNAPGFAAYVAALSGQLVAPGGRLVVAFSRATGSNDEGLKRDLLMGGLLDPTVAAGFLDSGSFSVVSGSKPQWSSGAKAAIKLPLKKRAPEPAAPVAGAWSLAGDDDLIDEDALLTAGMSG